MAKQHPKVTGTPAGTAGTSAMNNTALPEGTSIIGYVDPIIGRVAHRDVLGYLGFPLIRAGETVTRRFSPAPKIFRVCLSCNRRLKKNKKEAVRSEE